MDIFFTGVDLSQRVQRACRKCIYKRIATRCAKFFDYCPRLAPWKLISRVQGPAAKRPFALSLSLPLPPRLVFLIKCKHANRMEKRAHSSVAIVNRKVVRFNREREREDNFEGNFFFIDRKLD